MSARLKIIIMAQCEVVVIGLIMLTDYRVYNMCFVVADFLIFKLNKLKETRLKLIFIFNENDLLWNGRK